MSQARSPFLARCAAIPLPQPSLAEALASDAGRPILVFFGQSLDAWSWRMADALASDAELISLIGETCSLVCAEVASLPGPAQLCQQVLALSANAQGWPALLVLLPDGRPVGAMPYAPMRDAQRRRGVASVLLQVVSTWAEEPAALMSAASGLAEALAPLQQLPPKPQRQAKLILDACEAACMEAADTLEGGFGDDPRPLGHGPLSFLAQRLLRHELSEGARSHFYTSLNALISGGVHDHLAGGFHRGSQDRSWQLPFFDKRVGDSAQLIPLLIAASEAAQIPLYLDIATHSADWLLSLQQESGWFGHGLHALTPIAGAAPVEGATYAWNEAGAAAVVGREGAERFRRRYLSGPPLADGFAVPAARGELAEGDAEALPAICARLAQARRERPQPWADHRVILAEQGMLLSAFSALGSACELAGRSAETYQRAAQRLQSALIQLNPLPQVLGEAEPADALSLAWLGLGWLEAWELWGGEIAPARHWAAALWACRRADGSLPVQPQGQLPGDQLPAIADQEHSPGAAAIAARLFLGLGQHDPQWLQRGEDFLKLHRPLLALSPLPTAALAASLRP
ncbi:MAG: thioredoxin domain-containing protein [Planctomycetota bacterium]|nr:MAG: thioredoxin domain-containing protein [Planctomycetota bacterium]